MKKKLSVALLSLAMIFNACGLIGYAEDDISVTLNGETLAFDVPPQLIDNRTMVPLRKIFEAMGAQVDWNNDTQTVTATKGDERVIATINSKNVYVSGETKELDVPPMIVDGRTLVPARFVAESFGANVEWVEATKTVVINTENSDFSNNQADTPVFNIQDFTKGFELAEFSKYNSPASENGLGGSRIYFSGKINEIFFIETDANAGIGIMGKVIDLQGNPWLLTMNFTYIANKSEYDKFIGKPIVVCAIYDGYSGVYQMPGATLVELYDVNSGEIKSGAGKIILNSNNNNAINTMTDFDNIHTTEKSSTNQIEYDFSSTTGIESYLYDNYKTLDSDIGKLEFGFSVSDYGYYSEDFCIDVKLNEMSLGLLFEYGTVLLGDYTDSEIENGKEQLKNFMKDLAVDLIDKIPGKKLTGSYHNSYYRYPNLKMDRIIEDYCTWANYDRYNKSDAVSVSTFRWIPNLDGHKEY